MKSLATGLSPGKLFFDAIEKLNLPGLNSPVRHLRNFLDVGDDGIPSDSAVSLFLLGCDLCNPIESRIKLYVTDQIVTWDRVSAMWTLRGARQKDPQSDKGLTLLRKLWDLLEIPEGYRGNIRPDFPIGTPPPEDYRPVGMANWTLSTTKEFPDPQIYLLTFGMNDAKVVDALVAFYEVVGWVDLARSYREKVAAYL
ncbi:aromatic prenyltransferase [Aspergillus karnatakaensis]|uniref:aromatic prenyltransferase n=1 Tax=Aspergillus karnatakaensis TaxID=1810916 RepID=UPI003CCCC96F